MKWKLGISFVGQFLELPEKKTEICVTFFSYIEMLIYFLLYFVKDLKLTRQENESVFVFNNER